MDAEDKAYWRAAYANSNPKSPYEGVDWRAEIEKERALRECVVGLDSNDSPAADERKALQAWYRQVTFMLKYCLYYSRVEGLEAIPPVDMLTALARVTDFLARGIIPPFVSKVAKRGTPPLLPGEEVAIGWASAYINGCRIKQIDDEAHIKTICDIYSVKRQTAQKWGRMRLPEDLEGYALTPSFVTRHMEAAGKRYSLQGRSSKAILNRDSRK